jgi:hypothetical protein
MAAKFGFPDGRLWILPLQSWTASSILPHVTITFTPKHSRRDKSLEFTTGNVVESSPTVVEALFMWGQKT